MSPLVLRLYLPAFLLFAFVLEGCSTGEVANLTAPGETIVCFGDSITKGYGASPGNDYPSQLEQKLGRPVVNAGENGDTTADALLRLDTDVLVLRPRLVIIELAGNDLLRKIPKETTADNLETIVERCITAGCMVALVHGRLGLFRDPYWAHFKEIAGQHGAVIVKDSLRGILGNPRMMSDQIHPNDAGYALLAQRVAEVVGPLLGRADDARSKTAGD